MARIEKLCQETVATRNQIICANLRLVVSIAKRHLGPVQNFFELVSDGNVSLMRAVERFDYSLGNRFSTYATWAIINNFARTIPESLRHRSSFSYRFLPSFSRQPRRFPATNMSWRLPIPPRDRAGRHPAAARRSRAGDYRLPLRPPPRR